MTSMMAGLIQFHLHPIHGLNYVVSLMNVLKHERINNLYYSTEFRI